MAGSYFAPSFLLLIEALNMLMGILAAMRPAMTSDFPDEKISFTRQPACLFCASSTLTIITSWETEYYNTPIIY